MADTFDYVVVGAGSAGCALAARLSQDPATKVCLLEAGPADRNPLIRIPAAFIQLFQTKLDWAFLTEPQPALGDRRVYWPRGKVLGGSSSINSMMWVRGFAADYEEWAEHAGAGWSWASVLGCFCRMEDTEAPAGPHQGRGGPMRISAQRDPSPLTGDFVAACQTAGVPRTPGWEVNAAAPEGVTLTMVNQRAGRRWSAADGYLAPARGRPNLTVVTRAHVTRVRVDHGRATGVEYVSTGGDGVPVSVRAEAEVILCGGTVSSPALLMLSGIGPAGHLRQHGIDVVHDSPEVGRNLADHLTAGFVASTASRETLYRADSPRQVLEYLARRRGKLSSNVAEAYAFVRSDPSLALPDLELVFAPATFLDQGRQRPTQHGFTLGALLLRPRSTGTVTLASADPLAAPRIDPRYLTDAEGADRATLVAGLERCYEILHAAPLVRHLTGIIQPRGASRAERVDAAIDEFSQTLYHPTGTCRMGADEDSVVDPDLAVRGVAGLRVADASVMPNPIRGHTNAASIMIGVRAGDLVTDGSSAPSP